MITFTSPVFVTDSSLSSYSAEVIMRVAGSENTLMLNFPSASVMVPSFPFFTLIVGYSSGYRSLVLGENNLDNQA
jgi:hypothetical protein